MAGMRAAAQKVERSVRNLIRGLPGDRWERGAHVSGEAPLLMGGCGRSGTTLVSFLVNAHPSFSCGEESRLFTTPGLNPARLAGHYDFDEQQIRQWVKESPSKLAFIERFFGEVARREGKPRWAEKTPGNVHVLDRIFESFPNARFVHVIRDGRDVACSYRTHPKEKIVRGRRVPTGIHRPMAECAQRWNDYVRAAMQYRSEPRYHELRYEELIEDPQTVLRAMFEFAGEEWQPDVLRFHENPDRLTKSSHQEMKPINSSAQGRWRNDMSAVDADEFNRVAGPLLIELGYAANNDWLPNEIDQHQDDAT